MTEREGRRLTADVGLAHLLPDHFARGRQFAGLAGISGTVAIQLAAHLGAIEVAHLRWFEALGLYGALWSLTVWVVPWERFGETWIAFISLASTLLIFATVWLSAGAQSPAWAYHVFVVFANALYLRRGLAYGLLPVTVAASVLPAAIAADRAAIVQQLLVIAPVYAIVTLVGTVLVGQLVEAVYARLREGETRQLYEEATRWSGQLEAIQEVTRRLNRLSDLPALYDAIAQQTGRVIAHDRCFIHLLEGDDLVLVAPTADPAADPSLAALVRPRDLNALLAGLGRNREVTNGHVPGDAPNALLMTPLTHEGQVLGVITLAKTGRNPFSDGDRRLMTIVAGQAATAVANARLHAAARRQAETDGLTGLLNHGAFHARLSAALAGAERSGEPVGVMMLDLDGFKQVNDAHGHPVGDEVLRRVGAALRAVARPGDVIARYGGDEFALVLPATTREQAETLAQRLVEAARGVDGAPILGTRIVPRVSAGVASRPVDGTTADALIACADRRLYNAKSRVPVPPRSVIPQDDAPASRRRHATIPADAPVVAETFD